jgi:hypothetical protein
MRCKDCLNILDTLCIPFDDTPIASVAKDSTHCKPFRLILSDRFTFWKKGMNKTQGKEVYANHCAHCGIIQGNGYVEEMISNTYANSSYSIDQASRNGSLEIHDDIEIRDVDLLIPQGYCGLCSKKLQPIKNNRRNGKAGKDWKRRRYHVKCWKALKQSQYD